MRNDTSGSIAESKNVLTSSVHYELNFALKKKGAPGR
jgi:hypothetical protein